MSGWMGRFRRAGVTPIDGSLIDEERPVFRCELAITADSPSDGRPHLVQRVLRRQVEASVAVMTVMVVLVFHPPEVVPPPSNDRFTRAEVEASRNLETPEGVEFQKRVSKAMSGRLGSALDECAGTGGAPPQFELLFEVGGDGKIVSSAVTPQVQSTVCVRNRLAKHRLPRPPRPGYWTRLSVGLRRR